MKLAQVNLTRGILIPGLGSTMKLENLECEQQAHGLLVTTPMAKVLIPWERVECVVTEWLAVTVGKLSPAAIEIAKQAGPGKFASLADIAAGAEATGTGIHAQVDRFAPPFREQLDAGITASIERSQLPPKPHVDYISPAEAQSKGIPQPPPPTKKGGRR